MKCDFCDTKATVFLTQLIEGQMKKVCLCETCAKEKGVTDPTGFSLADMVLTNFQKLVPTMNTNTEELSKGAGKTCPDCGFTMDDLRKVRRFGCGSCYGVFSGEVSMMLRGMHKGATHAGKVPEGLFASQSRHRQIKELRVKLEQAILTEDYEAAARLRDEINQLATLSK
jgi:protein arginine kinase activator